MKKLIRFSALSLFGLAGLLASVNSYAVSGKVEKVFDNIPLAGTSATVTSRAINIGSAYRMGYWLIGNKAVTKEPISFIMRMEASPVDPSNTTSTIGFATHSTIHENYTSAGYTLPGVATCGTLSTVPAQKYVRFTLEGRATNATGTTVTAYIFTQD